MWDRRAAKLIEVVRDKITVLCPFCEEKHSHSRNSLGSKEVVAGCHVGGRQTARSYAIPDKR